MNNPVNRAAPHCVNAMSLAAQTQHHGLNRARHLHWFTFRALIVNELRLRTRRVSTLVAIMFMLIFCWSMIVDPQTGNAMMVVNHARVLYTSSVLAMGSTTLLGCVMSLLGFYLVRGRISEDIRSGIGSVIASTPVSNSVFIFCRWMGGVIYMALLLFAGMCSVMAIQVFRGDGSLQFFVFLCTYLLALAPMAFFVVSVALLFESIPFLMGKAGDVIYFFIWVLMISLLTKTETSVIGQISPWLYLDFSGMVISVENLKNFLMVKNFSIGINGFDKTLMPITLPVMMWNAKLVGMRVCTAFFAFLPLILALPLFHRFSPDKVKASQARARRSPIILLNELLHPLKRFSQPLFKWSMRHPNFIGQCGAELAMTLSSAPFSIAAIFICAFVSIITPAKGLNENLSFMIGCWGVLIADISTRNFQVGIESMSDSVMGGVYLRYLRQWIAMILLGCLFTGITMCRLSIVAPMLALTLIIGIVFISSLANLLGCLTKMPKTFLAGLMIWLYIALQTKQVAWLDVVGFNGSANWQSILFFAVMALVGLCAGLLSQRRR